MEAYYFYTLLIISYIGLSSVSVSVYHFILMDKHFEKYNCSPYIYYIYPKFK